MTDRFDRWALWVARIFALILLILGLLGCYVLVKTSITTHTLAQNVAALPVGDPTTPFQSAFGTLAIVFASAVSLGILSVAATFIFLASGLWRQREWARHGILVVAIAAIPVFIAMPFINWLIGIAHAGTPSAAGFWFLGIPAAIVGLLLVAITVYLFAYRPEIITLYTPRPHLTRSGTSKYAYTQTPILSPYEQHKHK